MAESNDLRQFMRELLLRHERIWQDQHDSFKRMHDEHLAHLAALQDLRDDLRAHTAGLMRVLDKLQDGGAPA